jgi:hypothetical protein
MNHNAVFNVNYPSAESRGVHLTQTSFVKSVDNQGQIVVLTESARACINGSPARLALRGSRDP